MRKALGFALLLLLAAPNGASAHLMVDGNAQAGLDSWAFSGNSLESSRLSFDGSLTDHMFELFGYLGNANSVVRVTPANFDELVPIGGVGGFRAADGATGFDLSFASSTAADHFEIAPFPNLQAALDNMLGVGAADLADTGSPFGPADFTGALQFDFLLAPGGSQGLGMTLIPEPTTAILLALGLLGLALAGRKRRT